MRTRSLYRIAVCTTLALCFQASVCADENPVCFLCEGDASATMLSPSAVIDMSVLQIEGVTFVTCEQLQNSGLARLLSPTLCDLASQSSALASCQCTNAVLSKASGSIPGLTPAVSPIVISDDQILFEKKGDKGGKGGKDGKTKAPKAPTIGKGMSVKAPKVKTPKIPKVKSPKTPKVKTPKAPKVKSTKAPKVGKVKSPKEPKDTLGKGKSKESKMPKDSKGTKAPKDSKGMKDGTSKGAKEPKEMFKAAYLDDSGLEYDSNGNVNLEQFLDRAEGIPYNDGQSVPTISPSLDIDKEITTLESMLYILKDKQAHSP